MPTPVPDPTTRAQTRAAASGSGAASTATPAASNPTVTDPTSGQSIAAFKVHKAAGHDWIKNLPVPMYRPMLAPGVRDRIGHSMSRCWIRPYDRTTAAGDPNKYMFVFHYNPDQVVVSSSTNPNIRLQAEVDTTTRNILATGGSLVISGLIDRSLEIASGALSRYPGPGNSRSFRKFGTLYDIEWLYRVANGDPKSKNNGHIRPLVPNQSNYGFLFPTTCVVRLNPTSRFLAFPTGIDIQHQMYTPSMVPMITTFSVTMLIAAAGVGSRSDLVDNPATTAPAWAPPMGISRDNFDRLTQ